MATMNTPTRSTGSNVGDRVQDLTAAAGQKAKETTSTIKDAAANVANSAEQAASYAAGKAGEAASFVGHKAEDATTAVAGGLKSLGQTIREHTPNGGPIGQASNALASGLENTGRYLEQEGLSGISADMTNLVRRNPIPAIFVALGIGFLVARATSHRS